jgi:hypothetical protein
MWIVVIHQFHNSTDLPEVPYSEDGGTKADGMRKIHELVPDYNPKRPNLGPAT